MGAAVSTALIYKFKVELHSSGRAPEHSLHVYDVWAKINGVQDWLLINSGYSHNEADAKTEISTLIFHFLRDN